MLLKSSSKLDRSLVEPNFCTLQPVDHFIDPKTYQYRYNSLIFKVHICRLSLLLFYEDTKYKSYRDGHQQQGKNIAKRGLFKPC